VAARASRRVQHALTLRLTTLKQVTPEEGEDTEKTKGKTKSKNSKRDRVPTELTMYARILHPPAQQACASAWRPGRAGLSRRELFTPRRAAGSRSSTSRRARRIR